MFRKHYSSLTSILPVKRLTSHFVSENVISFEEEDAILQTVEQSQAACKLLKNIRSSLEAGQTSSLDKLLCIMEQHGGLSCVELAKQMKDKLSRRSSGKVAMYCACFHCASRSPQVLLMSTCA